jgi:hypothetical protein
MSNFKSFRLKKLEEPVNNFLKKSDMTFSVMARTALKNLLLADKNKTLNPNLPKELKNLRLDLTRVGSNLNQIAYNFNINMPVSSDELKKNHQNLQRQFKTIIELLKKIENELEL